jgi:hypothetical protein
MRGVNYAMWLGTSGFAMVIVQTHFFWNYLPGR